MLITAAAQGDVQKIERALVRVADVHAANDEALCRAAENGQCRTVALLLGHGADIHAEHELALRWAAKNGHRETVALLLGHGTDIHAEHELALRWAAKNDHRETVALLLDRGADIHAEHDGALFWATWNGHTETVALLLDRGADVHAGRNSSMFELAFLMGRYGVATLLLHYGADPSWNQEGLDGVSRRKLGQWLAQLKEDTARHFPSSKPTRSQCFRDNGTGPLQDCVFNACVTNQFLTLVGAPLIASTAQADRQLFRDIWDALPRYWQDRYQNLLVQFAKEGGVKPIVGHHTSVAHQRGPNRGQQPRQSLG